MGGIRLSSAAATPSSNSHPMAGGAAPPAPNPLMFGATTPAAIRANAQQPWLNPSGPANQQQAALVSNAMGSDLAQQQQQQMMVMNNALLSAAAATGAAGTGPGATAGAIPGQAGGQVVALNRDATYQNSAIIPNYNHNHVSSVAFYLVAL